VRKVASVGEVTPVDEETTEPSVPHLEIPAEPVELRDGLREALLNGGDWRAGFSDDICVGVWLWSIWQPTLEPSGCSREDFVDIVIANRRELWLWLLGDRRWEQYASGLAGRVIRRMPTIATS